jgi:hypothetical protein
MRTLLIALWVCASVAFAKADNEGKEFLKKLNSMLIRTEQSEKVLRQQITESQNAPFLPDLYLQLAQLLSERSNTLYYIQMEKQGAAGTALSDKDASPVIAAQKEAIAIYQRILKDFPKFDKRKQVLYRMSLALKSIDEPTDFVKITDQLVKEYPNTEESIGGRLLLGSYFYENKDYKEALNYLLPVAASTFSYERNLAKHRIGMIYIAQEQFKAALTQFEQIIADPDLKERDNPYSVNLKKRETKSDLKREVLIDSILAYTHVYEKDADPVGYYSKLAPTEIHFQEVIEKLSLRYINMKKYDTAIRLLRTFSERVSDPQRVINIYHQVLLMIPVKDRIYVPAEEMRFVLEKYSVWTAYYQVQPKIKDESYVFFEKQVRELGTSSHSWAKAEKDPKKKAVFLQRARDFYLLYLAYFRRTPNSVKMATNLGDVYFSLEAFPESGDYYLRTFLGEFGPVPTEEKKLLVENSILCLQKKGNYSFYENLRMRGLLIKAVESYIAFDKRLKKDPALNFLLVKSAYEQGFFPEVLNRCFNFMKTFPKDRRTSDAGELILDYFNTRNDYAGLDTWSGKMLALQLPSEEFRQKLTRLRKQAKAKFIHEKIRSVAGYDDFAQGKSYLNVALSSNDESVRDAVLQEALNKSKKEKDIQTFLKAALVMAQAEKNPEKRSEILRSVAREYLRVTQYYRGLGILQKLYGDSTFTPKVRGDAFGEAVSTALLLRDWRILAQLMRHPMAQQLSDTLRTRMRDQVVDAFDSPNPISGDQLALLAQLKPTEDSLVAMYKAQFKVTGAKAMVLRRSQSECNAEAKGALCLWFQWEHLEPKRIQFAQTLASSPRTLAAIQAMAQGLMQLTGEYKLLESSPDPHLQTVVAARTQVVYRAFGEFLEKAAAENAELKPVLLQKAQESLSSAKLYQEKCRLIWEKSSSVNPATRFCLTGQTASVKDLLEWPVAKSVKLETGDPEDEKLIELEKFVFAAKDEGDSLLNLAAEYLNRSSFRHASAAATYGLSLYKSQEKEFRAILGCSVLGQGYFSEANYHLKNANAYNGYQEKCQKQLESNLKDLG